MGAFSLIVVISLLNRSAMSSFQWTSEPNQPAPELKIYNSFTRKKDTFVPLNGKTVTWYCCGPTAYDSSHMGHARAYITFDIIKRIIRDYFSYDVFSVMNITDIDDKIIKRARQRNLFEKYKSQNHTREKVINDVAKCSNELKQKLATEKDPDKLFTLNNVKAQIDSTNFENDSVDVLIEKSKDALMELLDHQFGHEVNEKSIFEGLARFYERDYFEDMKNLGIEMPDVLTRVTEYVPEIVTFVQTLIDKGVGYESNGSVYFDVDKFTSKGHYYAKLVPEALGDESKLKEGEGGLSVSDEQLQEKRSPRDFALWKKSKAGEPFWESPWGQGRPGWHIECSVMASEILGKSIDIHGGGVDLEFPHHDNEIAQAEAYFGNNDWIRYFLHSGHLNIEGRKMSKSLKNFTSIKSALETYSATQIRILFLLHEWSSTLDYGYETMKEALSYEKYLSEFFLAVKDILRSDPDCMKMRKVTETEKSLFKGLIEAKKEIHAHLCDSFNTPRVMLVIKSLISSINTYIQSIGSSEPNYALLRAVATYVTHLLTVFGVISKKGAIGFSGSGDSEVDGEKLLLPFLDTLAQFREDARQCAFSLLKSCDVLRDDVLPNQGVRLEDKQGQKSVIKYVGREAIERERKQAEELRERKQQEKENLKKRQNQQNEQNKIDPKEMFKGGKFYSAFNERGIPTHLGDGAEISDGQRKKLVKQYEQQRQKYDKYLKEQQKSNET